MNSRLSQRNTRVAGNTGFSLVELLMVVAIVSILLLAINGLLDSSLKAARVSTDKNNLTQEVRFALQRMSRSIERTDRLVLPLADHPGTSQLEHIRDPGVLAVAMDASMDRDEDGFADADNDKDGRVDEDFPGDATNDAAPGIVGIDDNNDGSIDVSSAGTPNMDDDEDNLHNEDNFDGIDNDGDGLVDEDMKNDRDDDSAAGIMGVDDDGDGSVDEGNDTDDDEDGSSAEDWLDTVVYFLNGTQLVDRMPNLNPVDGTDFSEQGIADNVTSFRVERIVQGKDRFVTVDLQLELSSPETGETVSLHTRVRVGGAL